MINLHFFRKKSGCTFIYKTDHCAPVVMHTKLFGNSLEEIFITKTFVKLSPVQESTHPFQPPSMRLKRLTTQP